MDLHSNDEENNKRNRCLNIIFLGIFLAEIIIYLIGIVVLPIRTDFLIVLVSAIFISGIYTYFKKTLLHLSAFCIVNMMQSIILIDVVRYTMANIAHTHVDWFLFSPIIKPNVIGKLQGLQSNYEITNEKLYRMTLIFPNIIAIAIIIFFVILYIVLIIIMWRNNYWNVISHTEILISNDILKKSYVTYEFYNFLLYLLLQSIFVFSLAFSAFYNPTFANFIDICFMVINFLPLFTLTFSLKISVSFFTFYWFILYIFQISGIVGLILLGLTFINTILCHRNFGSNLIFRLKFNPIMDKEFEYSNDLDDDDDDDDEEDEKDEKFSEKLNRYWKLIKKSFYDAYIFLVE
ncbi:hypothetical protein GLOIN_2v1569739 [Rhizophagus clarus]|uniref:Uncharacterized protein n=1 Tax=Rhizophagus clarus TaxID=94130 RepID=A0A8H3LLA1_9GLOM|nr:hypothetical protein GLOIN_2v1569739 [Rhizophagus clarus]